MTGTASDSTPTSAGGSRWIWLLPALTFVAGAALGAAVVAASGDDDHGGRPAAAPAPTATPQASPTPAGLVVTVPQPCLDAADGVAETSQEVRGAVDAVRSLDARRLQEIVDRIQALQPRVQMLADTCRAAAGSRLENGTLTSSPPVQGTPGTASSSPSP